MSPTDGRFQEELGEGGFYLAPGAPAAVGACRAWHACIAGGHLQVRLATSSCAADASSPKGLDEFKTIICVFETPEIIVESMHGLPLLH